MNLCDTMRENRIEVLYRKSLTETDKSKRRAILEKMAEEMAARSAEAIEELERNRGLR